MKKSGWKIILGVAVLVCVICLGRFGWVKYQDYKTEQARKATLKEIASTEFTGENEGKEPEKVPAGVKHGQKINFKKHDQYGWKVAAIFAAFVIKIVGYYIAEIILYGNFIAPISSVPGNVVQIAVAAVVVLIVIEPIEIAVKKIGITQFA